MAKLGIGSGGQNQAGIEQRRAGEDAPLPSWALLPSQAGRRGRDAVLLAVEWCYDSPEFGGYLGNVG